MIDYLFFSMDNFGRALGIMLVIATLTASVLTLQADNSERNTPVAIIVGVLLGIVAAFIFYVSGGIDSKSRLEFCNKYESLNSENLEKFASSCIFYNKLLLFPSSRGILQTDEYGHLEVVISDNAEREIIETSYNKVVDQVVFGSDKVAISKALNLFDEHNFPALSKETLRNEQLNYLERNLNFKENTDVYYKITKLKKSSGKELINHEDLESAEKLVAKLKELEVQVDKFREIFSRYCFDYEKGQCVLAKSKILQATDTLKKIDYNLLESALLEEKKKISNSRI